MERAVCLRRVAQIQHGLGQAFEVFMDIINAVLNWQSDTKVVSAYLDSAISDDEFLNSFAQATLNNELDELNHKAILDAQLCGTTLPAGCKQTVNGNDDVINANIVLVEQGTFQSVVDLLQGLANFGAIDTYFKAASDFIISAFNDHSLEGVTAVRPSACSS